MWPEPCHEENEQKGTKKQEWSLKDVLYRDHKGHWLLLSAFSLQRVWNWEKEVSSFDSRAEAQRFLRGGSGVEDWRTIAHSVRLDLACSSLSDPTLGSPRLGIALLRYMALYLKDQKKCTRIIEKHYISPHPTLQDETNL